jgi:hypothetical protein
MKGAVSNAVIMAILTMIVLSTAGVQAEYHNVTDCTICHYGGYSSSECAESPNVALVRDEIPWPPGSDPKPTVFGPYVVGQPLHNGVCEVCHTDTAYYRNNDTGGIHPEYKAGAMGPSQCNLCHKHAPYEFGHEAAIGTGCDPCHGQAGGVGTAFSHATHTAGDIARGPGGAMACDACHDTNNYPLFGEDGAQETLAATTACDNCHSPGGAFEGVAMAKGNWDAGVYESDGVTLKSGMDQWCAACHDDEPAHSLAEGPPDTFIEIDDDSADCSYDSPEWSQISGNHAYGDTFLYADGGDGTRVVRWMPNIPFTGRYKLRMWNPYSNERGVVTYTIRCAEGALTVDVDQGKYQDVWLSLGSFDFAAGTSGYVELGNAVSGGSKVNADAMTFERVSTYAPNVMGDNSTYGFYVTGHGRSGWVGCLVCHDASKPHIDEEHRTYRVVNDGQTDDLETPEDESQVVINQYVESYRLKDDSLRIPAPTVPKIDLRDYTLCFECHSSDELLGQDLTHTNFWDGSAQVNAIGNAHAYHLGIKGFRGDTDWDGTADAPETCITCHNIHGSPARMIRHGELISTPGTTDKVPALNFTYTELQSIGSPATATFTSSPLTNTADYNVYAWWTSTEHRTQTATYTVYYDGVGSPATVTVDQRVNGGQWNLLGTYSCNSGSLGTVVLDNNFKMGLNVVADAIKWEEVGNASNPLIVDNVDAVFVDDHNTWGASTNLNPYGSDVRYIKTHWTAVANPQLNFGNSEGGWTQYGSSAIWSNHVCRACHGEYEAQYRRPPAFWPKIYTKPGAVPDAVPNDGTGLSLIGVTISCSHDDLNSVLLDLSSIGGSSSQTMYDDGSNGDEIPGDDVYSYQLTVPDGTADGFHSLQITATDGSGNTGLGEVLIFVRDPDAIYADDDEAAFVPDYTSSCDADIEWCYSANREEDFGVGVRWKGAGDGTATATWTPTVSRAGNYEVYAWWTATTNRATDAPYIINYNGGTVTIDVNQQVNGGQWNLLDTVPFAQGTSGTVVLTDDANGLVIADAIKLVPVP